MPYFIPQSYECPRCGFKMDYSESITYKFLPVSENGAPFCYDCLMKFISENVPVMESQK